MAKDKKLVEHITAMDEDFAQWYTDVVRKAELCDYTSVKGCMVFKPAGYAIWELIQKNLDERFKATGVENVYLPMFIPESLLEKEKDHVEGFAPEVAWVTHGGLNELQERLCVRPTSETLFCDFYSKEIESYRDLPKVYNQWCSVVRWEKETRPFLRSSAMIVESLLGIIALVVVGAVAVNGTKPEGTPFAIFSSGVAGFLEKLGLPVQLATVFMTMCVSALALTSLDSVARIGRMSFQELFLGDTTDTSKMPVWQKILTNKYFATVVTLFFGYLLTLGGYTNVWPLFGSANQLLAALVLIALAVFLKTTGRTGWTLYAPMFIMLAVTFTALVQKTIALVKNIAGGNATMLVDGLQFIVAILLMVLGVLVAFSCLKKLFTKKAEAEN